MINSPYFFDKREAIRHLIEEGAVDTLGNYLPVDPAFPISFDRVPPMNEVGIRIIIEAERMGYAIERNPVGIEIIEK